MGKYVAAAPVPGSTGRPIGTPETLIGLCNIAPGLGNATPASSTHATGYQARASTSPDSPQACSTTTQSTQGNNTPPSGTLGQTPTTPAGTPITDSVIDPQLLAETNAAPINLRLERAKANSEKKRKPEGKAGPSASKKQKTKAVGLAVPDTANTIRNICTRRWIAQQPGGQGLATKFDAYFKALSIEDKEPFKKELRVDQGTARKAAKLVAKAAAAQPVG